MNKEIIFNSHAYERISFRGTKFNLTPLETRERIFKTIFVGKEKKYSKKHKTKYLYFKDNLSFYVIYKEKEKAIYVKTIIIKKGRE